MEVSILSCFGFWPDILLLRTLDAWAVGRPGNLGSAAAGGGNCAGSAADSDTEGSAVEDERLGVPDLDGICDEFDERTVTSETVDKEFVVVVRWDETELFQVWPEKLLESDS